MIRSCLYVPGTRPDRLTGALRRGADVIIADLEDAVAPDDKATARTNVAAWLDELDRPRSQPWVRVNSDSLTEDITAVARPGLAGLVLPKLEDPDTLVEVDALLTKLEGERDLAPTSIEVAPLIESANGVLNAPAIARGPRVSRLQLGEADLSADLGVSLGPEGLELLYARSQVILASAGAGLAGAVGPVWTAIDDLDGLRRSSLALKDLGFRARSVIHPKHIEIVNAAFTPDATEIARARELVARYDRALAEGQGAIRDADGTMIDEAMVRTARELLGVVDADPGAHT